MAVAYNTRKSKQTVYKNGKKQNIFIRFLHGLFPIKGDTMFEIVRKVIFLIALMFFLYFGGDIVFKLVNEFKSDLATKEHISKIGAQVDINDPAIQKIITEKPTMLPEFIQLYSENNDFVGHIRIGDAERDGSYVLDYPVYQSEDNEYYLKHTAEHKYSDGGAIFADYRNKFTPEGMSANTIMYGHNFMTGGYFTNISMYYNGYDKKRYVGDDLDFYRANPTILFDTLYEKGTWKVFACILMNTQEKYGEVYDYTNKLSFPDADSFNEFILEVMDRSALFTDVDLTYGDNIITLSTCHYPYGESVDTRCVVFARKVRDGESAEVNTNKAISNTSELRWQGQIDRLGTNWNGRVWDTSYLLSYNG